MKDVMDFLDYREYLGEFYRWRKTENSFFSYRAFAMRLRMDVSQIHRIVNGTQHLPYNSIQRTALVLGLGDRESRYFELLVKFARSRSAIERQALLDQIGAMRAAAKGRADFGKMEDNPSIARLSLEADNMDLGDLFDAARAFRDVARRHREDGTSLRIRVEFHLENATPSEEEPMMSESVMEDGSGARSLDIRSI